MGCYTPTKTMFPFILVVLDAANWNCFQLVGYSFLNIFHCPKVASSEVDLQSGKEGKLTREETRGVAEPQECHAEPKNQILRVCHGALLWRNSICLQFFMASSNSFSHPVENLMVSALIHSYSLGHKFLMDNLHNVKKADEHLFDI